MSRRAEIPAKTVAALLVANNHSCCVCNEPRKHVQIHHIDGDPSNSEPSNLAVLCLDCHSRVSGDEGFGRRFTADEIREFKQRWEARCAVARAAPNASMIEAPLRIIFEVTRLGADQHKVYDFQLEEGQEPEIVISSDDEFIDVSVCTPRDYDRWLKEGDLREFEGAEEVREWESSFQVPRGGRYLLLLINFANRETEVEIDAAVWEAAGAR